MRKKTAMAAVWAAALAAGCRPPPPPAEAPAAEAGAAIHSEIVVFAAASAQESVEAIVSEFERLNPGVDITCSFASSATLAQQIAGGAAADLFLSASPQWVDFLRNKELLAESHDLLGNQLATVVAAETPLRIAKPADLLNDDVEHLALADPESVPAGIYARQALEKLGLWERVKEKVVAGNDVRHALAMVETGAAEAAIVYATDAAVSEKVQRAFLFDRGLSEPIVYPLALAKRGAANSEARELYHYLQSPDAAAVFRRSGFCVEQAAGVQ